MPDATRQPDPSPALAKPQQDGPIAIYTAAALGAFFLAIGDLFTNNNAATTMKIAEVIKQHLFVGFDLAIFIIPGLMVLACCLCWVFQPQTRIDGFGRGFALFAMLSVATPYGSPPQGVSSANHTVTASSILGIGAAFAAESRSAPSTATVIVSFEGRSQPPSSALLTLRDPRTARILGQQTIRGPVTLAAQPGTYEVEIEANGYRKTTASVQIQRQPLSYTVSVQKTFVPLALQRLWAPKNVQAR